MDRLCCGRQKTLCDPEQTPYLNRLAQLLPHFALERLNRGLTELNAATGQYPVVRAVHGVEQHVLFLDRDTSDPVMKPAAILGEIKHLSYLVSPASQA